METNYTKIGIIGKSFGTEGFNRIKMYDDFFDVCKKQDFIFLQIDNYFVPFRVVAWKNNHQLVKFDDISTQFQADKLHKSYCYLPTSKVEHLIEKEDFPILGFTIFNGEEMLGEIVDLHEMTEQFLAVVIFNEKEVFIPIHESMIISIDSTNKQIIMDLPEGLLDL